MPDQRGLRQRPNFEQQAEGRRPGRVGIFQSEEVTSPLLTGVRADQMRIRRPHLLPCVSAHEMRIRRA